MCESIGNCIITGNSSGNSGGGLSSCSSITNCVITHNLAGVNGGALDNCSEVINCTVTTNHANGKGGAIYIQGYAKTANCILWNNTAADGVEICLEPYIVHTPFGDREYPSSMDIQFSDIRGGLAAVSATDCIVNWGSGNLDVDPCFADPENDDYHLQWDSLCIDAGDPNFPDDPNEHDIDNEPRVMGDRVDIGADEVGPKQADLSRDGLINFEDYSILIQSFGSGPADPNWYLLSNLYEDERIDYNDLVLLIDDWLWQAAWHK